MLNKVIFAPAVNVFHWNNLRFTLGHIKVTWHVGKAISITIRLPIRFIIEKSYELRAANYLCPVVSNLAFWGIYVRGLLSG